jgi:hypothetical protein
MLSDGGAMGIDPARLQVFLEVARAGSCQELWNDCISRLLRTTRSCMWTSIARMI